MLLLPFQKEITLQDFDKLRAAYDAGGELQTYELFSVLYDLKIIALNSEIQEMINIHFLNINT